jgi:hypothetical protein
MDLRWIAGREPGRSRAGALLIAAVSEEHEEWTLRERVVKGTIISAADA